MTADPSILPGSVEVPIDQLESSLVRMAAEARGTGTPRSLTCNVVVIGSRERLAEAAAELATIAAGVGMRTILIAAADAAAPVARVAADTVALEGLRPAFVNNAVACLRLSSVPTLVWWRGGAVEHLDGMADLADRLVIDVEDAEDAWARAAALLERTALTDLRWTRLTRWRALMAHFFDLEAVRAATGRLRRLTIAGADLAAARLFAGWLRSSLEEARLTVDLVAPRAGAPVEAIELAGDAEALVLRRRPHGTCLEAVATINGRVLAERVVPLRDEPLALLIREELRVRSRDVAFERALRAAGTAA